jgi:methyltransferase (TIGR00027 family)
MVIMKEHIPSKTAERNAFARALESRRPEDIRVCYDPLAKYFMGTRFAFVFNHRILLRVLWWISNRVRPGLGSFVIARTRYIDDYLHACIEVGLEQLVILGAGYDSRAYRFDELKGKVKVFEVDYPATQKLKIEKIKNIFGILPDYVVYVSTDFEKEKLHKRLFESGYDKKLKTLFIWEGVTYYITADAVDETLTFVASNSGRGSSIIFDYLPQSVVGGTSELKGAKGVRKQVEQSDEALIFGIEAAIIEEFLSERGFCQVKNINSNFFKRAYFKEIDQGRKISGMFGIVHATVKLRNKT